MAIRDIWHRNHLIRDAIGRAIFDRMKADPSIYLFGEGMHMKIHFDAPQIERDYLNRVQTLPVSEDGNTFFAVGASLLGVKPIVDVITADFLYRTLDSICNTAAKLNFVAAKDELPKTIVIRSEFLVGGPTTGQRPEALFVHIPGLKVVLPSTPKDAYGLMRTALTCPGVTVFFEDRMIKDVKTKAKDYDMGNDFIPFGSAWFRIRPREAKLLIVTYGLMRQTVEFLLDQECLENIVLLDLRTLYPIDWVTLIAAAEETGRMLLIEPDVTYGGIGAEIAATVAERCPFVRTRRLGAPRLTIPGSIDLHDSMTPTPEEILAVIEEVKSSWT